MHINGKKMTAEDLMRMVLINPTDTPEQKANMEAAIKRSSEKQSRNETKPHEPR